MFCLIKRYFIYLPLFYILFLYQLFLDLDFFLPGITSDFVLILTLIFCLGIVVIKKQAFCFNRLDLFFLTFLIWHTVIAQTKSSDVNSWSVIQAVTYAWIYIYFRNTKSNKLFFPFLFIAGLFQAIWSILQKNGVLPPNHPLLDMTGGFFNPAILGLFLVLALLAGLLLWKTQTLPFAKCLLVLSYLILLYCIILTNSRASWLALFMGCAWLYLTGMKRQRLRLQAFSSIKPILKYSLIFTIAGILLYFAIVGLYYIRTDSVQGRLLIWQVIGSHLPQSPWTGQGPLQAHYMSMQSSWFQAHPDSSFIRFAGNNLFAFNEFLRIAFESGIIGLILFSGLLITGVYTARTGNKNSRSAGSLLIAVITFSLFGYPLSVPLIIISSLITLAIISQNAFTSYRISLSKSRWIILLFLAVFLLFTVREYAYGKKADLLLKESRHSPTALTGNVLLRCYKHLQGNPDFMLCYGKNLYEQGLYDKALKVLEQGYRLKPSSELVCDLGKCYLQAKMFNKAEKAFSIAAGMTPAFIMPRYHLFCLYQETGQEEKALKEANIILTMPVKVVNTSVLRIRNQIRQFLKHPCASPPESVCR